MKEKKQIRAPHVFVLIMIICATALTYILPAGTYNRYVDETTGTTLVEDGSYQQIEQTPVDPFKMLQAIPNGLVDATSIVSLVLMYGGAFGIINSTRVIECGIASSIEKMRRFSVLILPVIMILFSLMGAMLGISESCYAFIPLCIMLAKAMDPADRRAASVLRHWCADRSLHPPDGHYHYVCALVWSQDQKRSHPQPDV